MANLATLKAALNAAIYQNNQNAITGEALNTILNSIIDTLGAGYRYAGVATPSANPGTIDNRVFYLATAAGTYTNFGAVQLDGKKLHIFIYDTTWHDIALDVPTNDALAVVAGGGVNSIKGKDPALIADGNNSVAFGNADEGEIAAGGNGSFACGYTEVRGGISSDDIGDFAHGYANEGALILASGQGSHAEGFSHVDGEIIASGQGSHAEGFANDALYASGNGAHAEGDTSIAGAIVASGQGSHAEGSGSTASGNGAHAEGLGSAASGNGAHAEGASTEAAGVSSHSEGLYTKTTNEGEHAEGKYNASHRKTTGTAAEQAAGTTLSSVGCGAGPNERKNAIEVMRNGDIYIEGAGGYDGTNPAQENISPLNSLFPFLFCVAPPTSGSAGAEINYANHIIIVDKGLGYAFTPTLDYSVKYNIYTSYFESAIASTLQITPTFDNVQYVGMDPSAVYTANDGLDSGAVCCVYFYNGTRYYFVYEA